jgi:hypothetical protein
VRKKKKRSLSIVCILFFNKSFDYLSAQEKESGGVWLEELKFNKHGSTFVLFDKKFSILD